MAKRITALLLAAVVVFALAACGSSAGAPESKPAETTAAETTAVESVAETTAAESAAETTAAETTAQAQEETTQAQEPAGSGDGILVVYFSRTGEQYGVGVIDKGNTEIVAEVIIDRLGADRFQILPEDDYYPYTYDELLDVAKKEQSENARPAYIRALPDLSNYGTIFIGAPVWWGDWPMICYTFFEENADALAGKTLIPFCTHAGSGLSGFDKKLASACPDSEVGDGLAIEGADAQNDMGMVQDMVNAWLASLGF